LNDDYLPIVCLTFCDFVLEIDCDITNKELDNYKIRLSLYTDFKLNHRYYTRTHEEEEYDKKRDDLTIKFRDNIKYKTIVQFSKHVIDKYNTDVQLNIRKDVSKMYLFAPLQGCNSSKIKNLVLSIDGLREINIPRIELTEYKISNKYILFEIPLLSKPNCIITFSKFTIIRLKIETTEDINTIDKPILYVQHPMIYTINNGMFCLLKNEILRLRAL
jgi:hypothetical protein